MVYTNHKQNRFMIPTLLRVLFAEGISVLEVTECSCNSD